MPADLGDLYARLRLDTHSLDEAQAKVHGLGGSLISGMAVAGAAVGATGVVIAGVAVKMAADFQTLTTQIVTGAGESVKNLELIRQGVLALAPAVGSSPQELAKALYLIESAGFHGAAGLAVLKASAEGAKVGLASQETVANAVTSALNAYSLGSDKATQVTNDLIATEAAGKLHMEDLASAISAVLAPASALGVSLPEVSAAIATMSAQGTDANRATQSLRFIIAALTGPTAAAAKEMKGLGVGMGEIPGITASATAEMGKLGLKTSDVAYTLSHQGLEAALKQVTDAIGKQFPAGSAQYNAALRDAVGGTRGFTAALELTGAHTAVFKQNIADIGTAFGKSGTSVDNWNLIQGTLNQKISEAKAGIDVLLITLGTALLPIVSQVVDWFSKLLSGFEGTAQQAGGPLQSAIRGVLGVLQTMGAWIGANVIPVLTSLASWFGDHIVPVIGQVVSWVEDKLLPSLGHLVNTFRTDVLPALEAVGAWVITNLVTPLVHFAEFVIPPVIAALDSVVRWVADHVALFVTLGGAFAALWATEKIAGWVSAASSAIKTIVEKISTGAVFNLGFGGGGGATKALSAESLGVQKVWIVGSDVPLGGGLPGGIPGATPPGGSRILTAGGIGGLGLAGDAVGAGAFVSSLAAAAPLMAIFAGQLNTLTTTFSSGDKAGGQIGSGPFGASIPGLQTANAVGGGAFKNLQDLMTASGPQAVADFNGFASDLHDLTGSTSITLGQIKTLEAAISAGTVTSDASMVLFETAMGAGATNTQGIRDGAALLKGLMDNGLDRTKPQIQAFSDAWVQLQKSGASTFVAQQTIEKLFQDGSVKTGPEINQMLLNLGYVAQSTGGANIGAAAMEGAMSLAASHTSDVASKMGDLATATGTSIDAIISAYTLMPGLTQQMVADQNALNSALAASGTKTGFSFQHGGVGNFGAGMPAMLHGEEAILPRGLASPQLWNEVVATLAGGARRPPAIALNVAAGGSANPIASAPSSGGHSIVQHFYQANLSAADVSNELGWALKTGGI